MTVRPTVENIMFLHTVAIETFGGSGGILSLSGRPWDSSSGRDHFPTPFGKAAALAESIIRRHPFVGGNKRTAMYAAAYLLEKLGYELEAEQRELEDFAVSIARGTTGAEDIARWLEDHARKR